MRLFGERDTLVVSFGGCGEGYAWHDRLLSLSLPALCFQDSRSRWYLDGADGLGSWTATVARVREEIAERQPRRLAFIGQSAGGYAALRMGCEVPCDAVVAFSPQTHARDDTRPKAPDDLIDVRTLRSLAGSVQVLICEREDPTAEFYWNDRAQVEGLEADIHVRPYVGHAVGYHMARDETLNPWLLRLMGEASEDASVPAWATPGAVAGTRHGGPLGTRRRLTPA